MVMHLTEPKNLFSLIAGAVLAALTGIPLLNQWGVIGWNLPDALQSLPLNLIMWVVAVGGFWLIIESHFESHSLKPVFLFVGLIILALGLIPILNSFGYLPFGLGFLSESVWKVILCIEGILMMLFAIT